MIDTLCIGCCFIDTTHDGQDYCIPYNILVGSHTPHEIYVKYIHDSIDKGMITDETWQRITIAMKTVINHNIGPGTRFGDGK